MNVSPPVRAALAAALLLAPPCNTAVAAGAATLDPVVVTATRRAIRAERSLPALVVIDREEIERSQAIDIAELLRFHAGVEVARNGGPGQLTSVFIRGANAHHTLVLIDGVKVNPGTAGGAALQNIPAELVERIEIVKGPRSSLYGSEAIGGVIHILTRRGARGGSLGASAQAGRYGTRGGAATAAWQGERVGAGVSAASLHSDGFPTFRDSERPSGFDNDAFNAWLRAGFGALELEASHWLASGNVEYADFFRAPQDQDFDNRLSRLRMAFSARDWHSALTLSRFEDRIDQGELAFDPDDYVRTERDMLDWQNDLDLLDGVELTAGVTLLRERSAGRSFGTVLESAPGRGHADRNEDAAYLQAGYEFGRHRLAGAARRTDHQAFGDVNTWNLEWGASLRDDWTLAAGLGRGFRAPGSSDLYGFGGNPELDPEVSRSAELGLRHRPRPGQALELGLFRTEITGLIEFFDPDGFPGPLPGLNENLGKARIDGAELAWRWRIAEWSGSATLLRQRPEDAHSGERLVRRAERSATFSLLRRFGRHELGLQLLASGERRDVGDVRLAGYLLANLSARLELARGWTLRARIENLLDEDYELVEGYNSAGRGAYASLAYSY